MKSISEPIARRANAEDKVNGRFWQGRFKCQLLRDEGALLAAMTYVDLNPIRANIAPGLNRSKHTSLRQRYRETLRTQEMASLPLLALTGANFFNAPLLTNADYLALVDFTGRMICTGKGGAIKEKEPKAMTKLGLDPNHWSAKVKGVGNGYWRVVAEVEDLIALAAQFNLETAVGRTRVCFFLASQRGRIRQHAHCLQRRINETGESKKGAILFVANFTHKVNFETSKFINLFIALSKLVSDQLPFLGSSSARFMALVLRGS